MKVPRAFLSREGDYGLWGVLSEFVCKAVTQIPVAHAMHIGDATAHKIIGLRVVKETQGRLKRHVGLFGKKSNDPRVFHLEKNGAGVHKNSLPSNRKHASSASWVRKQTCQFGCSNRRRPRASSLVISPS